MKFDLLQKDDKTDARSGRIITDHSIIETPVFMPVGTMGSVKAVHQRELKNEIDTPIILSNTYHLFLRPGTEVIIGAGGLHKFIGWDRSMLTDSGGYQVFSLAENTIIKEEGVVFRSHIDGTEHIFTPENNVEIQRALGADIFMAFDECTSYPVSYEKAKESMELTHRWLKRGHKTFRETQPFYGYDQAFFPIIQGSTYDDLRKLSAETVASYNCDGNAIGGLSVGEPEEEMYRAIEIVNDILPEGKPRYLMGVGTPVNILEAIARGVDMFDCVMPTRNGRNGMLFTKEGIINIKNEKWKNDYSPIELNGASFVDRDYTKAYLRHLILSKEILGAQIASLHNISFYIWLVKEAFMKINEGGFAAWKSNMVKQLAQRL